MDDVYCGGECVSEGGVGGVGGFASGRVDGDLFGGFVVVGVIIY